MEVKSKTDIIYGNKQVMTILKVKGRIQNMKKRMIQERIKMTT